MVWKNPNNPSEGIAKYGYCICNDTYKIEKKQTEQERKADIENLFENLSDIWSERRGWWVSAVNLSKITDTYSRTHTNTDIAVMHDRELLQFMVENAKKHNLYLFKKLWSGKTSLDSDSPVKYECFWPVDVDEAVKKHAKNKNYQFCLVNEQGHIITNNSIHDRIKLYFHDKKGKDIISREEKKGILIPPEYLADQIIHQTQSGSQIYGVDILYNKLLLERILDTRKGKRAPKHYQDLEIIMTQLELQKKSQESNSHAIKQA